MLVTLINGFISLISTIVTGLFSILPNDPIQSVTLPSVFQQYLGYINWAFPLNQVIIFISGYVGCVLVWYGIRWVLRFTKFIT